MAEREVEMISMKIFVILQLIFLWAIQGEDVQQIDRQIDRQTELYIVSSKKMIRNMFSGFCNAEAICDPDENNFIEAKGMETSLWWVQEQIEMSTWHFQSMGSVFEI